MRVYRVGFFDVNTAPAIFKTSFALLFSELKNTFHCCLRVLVNLINVVQNRMLAYGYQGRANGSNKQPGDDNWAKLGDFTSFKPLSA